MPYSVQSNLWTFFEQMIANELTHDSPKAEQPSWIVTPLLPHQKASLAAAARLETAKSSGIESGEKTFFTNYGILGDRVGSGKSLIALSLLQNPPPAASYCEFLTRGTIGLLQQRTQLLTPITNIRLQPVKAALFIVPHAVFEQWEAYVGRDAPTLAVRFIKRKNDATADDLFGALQTLDAVFVSSTMFPTFKAYQQTYRILWSRIFVDEADSIHFSNTKDELHARFYWFISASALPLFFSGGAHLNLATYPPLPETPRHVQERVATLCQNTTLVVNPLRHMNLVSHLCSAGREMLYSSNPLHAESTRVLIRCNDAFLRESFAPPVTRHTEIVCATPPNINVLNSFVSPDMLERLNAGDLSGALTLVGMSPSSTTEITEAVTSHMKTELANAERMYEFKQSITYSSEAQKQKALEACQQKIASIRSRISAIEDRLARPAEQNCPICYCDVSGAAVTPCCNQVFCFSCLCESLRRVSACPLCRERISDLKTVRVVAAAEAPQVAENSVVLANDLSGAALTTTVKKPCNKTDAFLEFVSTHKDAKILLFSSYDASFAAAAARLEAAGIHTATVSGSGVRIQRLLREFAEGKYTVLFLNAKNMGAGLNIDAASHIFLYHKMSAELEGQIVGRAARLGRKAPLDVVHLVHENERTRA
jgi:hypothetical protein